MSTSSTSASVVKSLWRKTADVSRKLDNSLGAVHGIGLTEYMVLDILAQAPQGALRRIDLAEELGRTASGVTRLLKPMEKIGLVSKASSERDARVSLVQITAAGETIYSDATASLKQKSSSLLGGLTEEQTDTLLSMLRSIS